MYSAIKRQGQKLYELSPPGARRWSGTPVPSPSTPWRSWTSPLPTEYTLRVACSKGTYVRTLCHDIG